MFKFKPDHRDRCNSTMTSVSTSGSEALIDSSSDLEFGNITKLAIDPVGSLYVLDSTSNVIYRYNIKGLTRNDRILMARATPGRQLQSFMGGKGVTSDKRLFHQPIDMCFHHNRLYVVDVATRDCRIKVYDSQFNWLDTFNVSFDYTHDTPISMAINKDKIYILTRLGDINQYDLRNLEANRLASEKINANIIDFDFPTRGEEYISINFSPTNENLCYILTNHSIYKSFDNRLSQHTGKIDWEKHAILSGTVNRRRVKISPRPQLVSFMTSDVTVEDIMLINIGHGTDNLLLHFKENQNQLDMLPSSYETKIFQLSSIDIHQDEYVSSFVYNKAVSKLLVNINLIYNNLKHVATSELDEYGSLKYPGIRYLSEQEINTYRNESIELDVYVGVNEILTTATLNRCIKTIIDEQSKILKLIRTRTNPAVFFTAGTINLEKHPIPHLQYVLPSGITAKVQKI